MFRSTFLLCLALLSAAVFGQAEVRTSMTVALSAGNTGAVTEQLMPNVDLTVPGSSDLVSKAQAAGILKKFFDEHPAQGFTVDHEGNSKLGDHYCIGTLRTGNGAFRVTFLLKKAADRFQVKQLRIEPSNPWTVLPEGSDDLIRRALAEDIGDGDHTSLSTIPAAAKGAARLLVKQPGVLAGMEMAEAICEQFDGRLHRRVLITDGARISPGDVAFTITGPSRSILQVERVLLNFMQRMSGIATLTRAFVDALEGTGCQVLDTRKTTPTLRAWEKWAVRIGGGTNHRHGLYDMIMIKDNHVDMAGGIGKAIQAARDYMVSHGLDLPIEVETRDLNEVQQVLDAGPVHRIMLDNYPLETMRAAVRLINGRVKTEASGGITLQNARSIAECGVDFISTGALTHSAPSLDLSLKAMI